MFVDVGRENVYDNDLMIEGGWGLVEAVAEHADERADGDIDVADEADSFSRYLLWAVPPYWSRWIGGLSEMAK